MVSKILQSLFDLLLLIGGFFIKSAAGLLGLGTNTEHDLTGEFLQEQVLLSKQNKGFNLTGLRSLSVKDSYSNAIAIGGSGVGKTSVILIPSLLSMDSSLVVSDFSGELFNKTSGFLQRKGYEIKVLNYTRPDISVGFNVLARANSKAEIAKVAATLVRASMRGKSSNPFWNLQAIALLTLHISLVKKMDEQYQNLVNVRRLIKVMSGDPKKLDRLVVRYGNEMILESYKSFLAMAPNTFTGIAATTLAALNLFEDEQVAKITSVDTLDMDAFRERKVILYVQAPTIDMYYYGPLTSVLMEQMFAQVMKKLPSRNDQSVFFLLDEASSLTMPSMPITIANNRKYNAGLLLIYQDFNQVIENFDKNDAETIRSNCYAKLYFTGQGIETARVLETTLGKYTYEDEKGIKRVRPLLTADEIRTLPIDKALLICGHHRPVMANLRPYYKNRKVLAKTVYEPAQLEREIPADSVSFISLT